jgi:hypothetical protein
MIAGTFGATRAAHIQLAFGAHLDDTPSGVHRVSVDSTAEEWSGIRVSAAAGYADPA